MNHADDTPGTRKGRPEGDPHSHSDVKKSTRREWYAPVDEYNDLDKNLRDDQGRSYKRRLVTRNDLIRGLQRADLIPDPQEAHGITWAGHVTSAPDTGGYDGWPADETLILGVQGGLREPGRWEPEDVLVWYLHDGEPFQARVPYEQAMIHRAFEGSVAGDTFSFLPGITILAEIDFDRLREEEALRDFLLKMAALSRQMELASIGGHLERRAHELVAETKRVRVARAILLEPARSDRDIARELEVSPTFVGDVRREMDT